MKELNDYTKQKKMYCKNSSQKIAVVMIRTFTCDSPSYQLSYAFTTLLTSELCDTLVIQREFYTSIIVIVAFNAGIEASSINYLTLYRVARKTIHHCKEMNLYKTIHMTHCSGTSGRTVDRIKHNS